MNVPVEHVQVGRLALREEGDKWNAYYAVEDTMNGAVWLGSIAMRFVASANPEWRAVCFRCWEAMQ